jgi:hypothetical protein
MDRRKTIDFLRDKTNIARPPSRQDLIRMDA